MHAAVADTVRHREGSAGSRGAAAGKGGGLLGSMLPSRKTAAQQVRQVGQGGAWCWLPKGCVTLQAAKTHLCSICVFALPTLNSPKQPCPWPPATGDGHRGALCSLCVPPATHPGGAPDTPGGQRPGLDAAAPQRPAVAVLPVTSTRGWRLPGSCRLWSPPPPPVHPRHLTPPVVLPSTTPPLTFSCRPGTDSLLVCMSACLNQCTDSAASPCVTARRWSCR